MQYLTAFLVSLTIKLMISIKHGTKFTFARYKELRIGLLNNFTMFNSNYALSYVDYPTQALFKSSKILPVMGLGLIRRTYSYPVYKYVCAGIITLGLIVFNVAKLGTKVNSMSISIAGLFLIFLSLISDGLVATQTDKDKNKGEKSTPFDLMLSNNICGIASSILVLFLTFLKTGVFILDQITYNNLDNLLMIAIAGTMGQIFIYLTINRFDCFILSIVNTTRKFFSIVLSIFLFNHSLTPLHYFGIFLVIGSIFADMFLSHCEKQKRKKQDKNE